jgi:uncharacterized delta-60 repeat protein
MYYGAQAASGALASGITDQVIDPITGAITFVTTINDYTGANASYIVIGQLNSDGSWNTSFGGAGTGYNQIAVSAIQNGLDEMKIAVQQIGPNAGKFVVAFSNQLASDIRGQVWRFTTTGILDTVGPNAFASGTGQYVFHYTGSKNTLVNIVRIDSSDSIYACGYGTDSSNNIGWLIAKLTPNGGSDTTFGGQGDNGNCWFHLFTDTTHGAAVNDINFLNSGQLIVAGQTFNLSANGVVTLGRLLLPGGTIDPTYGTSGFFTVDPSGFAGFQPVSGPANGGCTHLTANDDIYVTGETLTTSHGFSEGANPWVMRFLASGALDPNFNSGGANPGTRVWNPPWSTSAAYSSCPAVIGGGPTIVVCGHSSNQAGAPPTLGPSGCVGGFWIVNSKDGSLDQGRGDLVGQTWPSAATTTTNAASAVTGTTATLNGTINGASGADGGVIQYWFDYDPNGTVETPDFRKTTWVNGSPQTVPADGANHSISANVTSLTAGVTYGYRLVTTYVKNGVATPGWGAVTTFNTTPSIKQFVTAYHSGANTTDLTGNGNTLTANGTVTNAAATFSPPAGCNGTALTCPGGSGNFWSYPSNSSLQTDGTTDCTEWVWFCPTAASFSGAQQLFGKGLFGSSTFERTTFLNTAQPQATLGNPTDSNQINCPLGANLPATQVWHLLFVRFQASTGIMSISLDNRATVASVTLTAGQIASLAKGTGLCYLAFGGAGGIVFTGEIMEHGIAVSASGAGGYFTNVQENRIWNSGNGDIWANLPA